MGFIALVVVALAVAGALMRDAPPHRPLSIARAATQFGLTPNRRGGAGGVVDSILVELHAAGDYVGIVAWFPAPLRVGLGAATPAEPELAKRIVEAGEVAALVARARAAGNLRLGDASLELVVPGAPKHDVTEPVRICVALVHEMKAARRVFRPRDEAEIADAWVALAESEDLRVDDGSLALVADAGPSTIAVAFEDAETIVVEVKHAATLDLRLSLDHRTASYDSEDVPARTAISLAAPEREPGIREALDALGDRVVAVTGDDLGLDVETAIRPHDVERIAELIHGLRRVLAALRGHAQVGPFR
jgi:hypothetical protein